MVDATDIDVLAVSIGSESVVVLSETARTHDSRPFTAARASSHDGSVAEPLLLLSPIAPTTLSAR